MHIKWALTQSPNPNRNNPINLLDTIILGLQRSDRVAFDGINSVKFKQCYNNTILNKFVRSMYINIFITDC